MGRELAVALASEGANVALCDVNADNLAVTKQLCTEANGAVTVSTHICDVTDETQLESFRDAMKAEHNTDHINLLFNNAGIGGTGSFLEDDRAEWELTFNVCWQGVYLSSRVFVPLLVASSEGHIINTSSINGLWASLGPSRSHTSYSAAKFAVRGFTEALITDLRLHAPHVKASVVMPGHIGTEIVGNSVQIRGGEMDAEVTEFSNLFRNLAPTTAMRAATVILDGVRAGQWRILIGEDANVLDSLLRENPEDAYEQSFVDQLHSLGYLQGLVS